MTEASVTQTLLAYLKQHLPGAVVIKTSDRITKGVPDVYVAWQGKNVWLEIKLLRKGETPATRTARDQLQLVTMQRLHAQGGGRAWYVLYDARNLREKLTLIYSPHALRPEENELDHCTVAAPGFDHSAVVRLLEAI